MKDHRTYKHDVSEWNSLQGVKDCCSLMSQDLKFEADLKDFFTKVTEEILIQIKSGNNKSALAENLAAVYKVQPEACSPILTDTDKSQELSKGGCQII